MTLAQALVSDFQAEVAPTRAMLAAVPEDKLAWTPHVRSMSLGRLAGHIAETPGWVRSMMEDSLDFALAGSEWTPFEPTSRAELLARFDRDAAAVATLLAGRDDDFMRRRWEMRHGEQVFFQRPRHAAIRETAIHHLVHHRGQLSVYLRLLDVPVPSTYGPTADSEAAGT